MRSPASEEEGAAELCNELAATPSPRATETKEVEK